MNGRTQWLFEAPFVSESDRYINPYTNPEYYSYSEWESQEDRPAGFPLGEEEWEVGKLLEQPTSRFPVSRQSDWAKLYLKSVRKGSLASLEGYIPMFTTITFHPSPLLSPVFSGIGTYVSDQLLITNTLEKPFLFELRRIRDARLYQDKNFKQLHENHRRLWRDVITSFKRVEPKDLEPLLIEALLSDQVFLHDQPFWNLGKGLA